MLSSNSTALSTQRRPESRTYTEAKNKNAINTSTTQQREKQPESQQHSHETPTNKALSHCSTTLQKISCRTPVVNFKSCGSAQTEPIPNLTIISALWGALEVGRVGRGNRAAPQRVLVEKCNGGPEGQRRPIRPTTCREGLCRYRPASRASLFTEGHNKRPQNRFVFFSLLFVSELNVR